MWISFFHMEEFFDNLASITIIRIDGLFGYRWHVIDINKIKFTLDMTSILPRQPIEFSNDRLAMYHTFSSSLDYMHSYNWIHLLDSKRLAIIHVWEQSTHCANWNT